MKRKRNARKSERPTEDDASEERQPIIGGHAKQLIAAIFLVMIGLLFLIAYVGAAGVLGGFIDRMAGVSLGWGKWLFPVILFLAALVSVNGRGTSLSDIARFIGLGVAFLSLLGFFHLFLGDSARELREAAEDGRGGGYLGYFFALALVSYTGKIAGAIILSAFLLAGIVAAFNVSFIHLVERFRRSEGETTDELKDDPAATAIAAEIGPESVPVVPSLPNEALLAEVPSQPVAEVARGNIAAIRFADDPLPEEDAAANVASVKIGRQSEERPPHAAGKKDRRDTVSEYRLPGLDLLKRGFSDKDAGDTERNKQIIQSTLQQFNVFVDPEDVKVGPMVTQYAFRPRPGTKISNVLSRSDDLALALAARSDIRIEAPIPGKSLIGIEVPNVKNEQVRLRDAFESPLFRANDSNLRFILGKDVAGAFIGADIESMPHLLIAGTTRSGKSVCIHSIILSLLYQNTPGDLRLILVDPKRVELSLYNGLPHLMGSDVIVESRKVVNALRYAVGEMESRLRKFQEASVRDIAEYRRHYERQKLRVSEDGESGSEAGPAQIPYLVIVIDEMADLMITHGKEVEALVVRLAQKSRAAGIHLVFATQRPDTSVVTGILKSNLPARIALKVRSLVDSRIVLDASGAEKLLGNGDMLYSSPTEGKLQRIQGIYVETGEVKAVVDHWVREKKRVGGEEIGENFSDGEEQESGDTVPSIPIGDEEAFSRALESEDHGDADGYEEAKRVVIESGRAATTYLQRRLHIGYGKAAGFLDRMEADGIVGPAEGRNRAREVFATPPEGAPAKPTTVGYDDTLSDQTVRDKWQV